MMEVPRSERNDGEQHCKINLNISVSEKTERIYNFIHIGDVNTIESIEIIIITMIIHF